MMVSANSLNATSGLVSHSHVNGCTRLMTCEGIGASFTSPYGVMKLRSVCCQQVTAVGFEFCFFGVDCLLIPAEDIEFVALFNFVMYLVVSVGM